MEILNNIMKIIWNAIIDYIAFFYSLHVKFLDNVEKYPYASAFIVFCLMLVALVLTLFKDKYIISYVDGQTLLIWYLSLLFFPFLFFPFIILFFLAVLLNKAYELKKKIYKKQSTK